MSRPSEAIITCSTAIRVAGLSTCLVAGHEVLRAVESGMGLTSMLVAVADLPQSFALLLPVGAYVGGVRLSCLRRDEDTSGRSAAPRAPNAVGELSWSVVGRVVIWLMVLIGIAAGFLAPWLSQALAAFHPGVPSDTSTVVGWVQTYRALGVPGNASAHALPWMRQVAGVQALLPVIAALAGAFAAVFGRLVGEFTAGAPRVGVAHAHQWLVGTCVLAATVGLAQLSIGLIVERGMPPVLALALIPAPLLGGSLLLAWTRAVLRSHAAAG